ncbi:AAA family ATPase [Nonomuraea sp. H19]|uniref:AAA family ATPase n=1 Tax=Nonomuraea sp. H19 TaxID=3452206 RepID=UPI003F8A2A7F
MLYGRQAEQSVIGGLLEGRSGALVVRGEAGIGKSALLECAAAKARARVLRVTGVESEADLSFAALHLLLRPVVDHIEALPPQQAEALRGALGLGGATRGDRFLVGLATLSLLVELSAAGPVVCLVDDGQWLDGESADALLFAARRLHDEPVAVLFAAREGDFPARGLPELRLGKLDTEAARKLLAEQAADLPPAVRDQVVAEAGGNPLALVELPRMLTAEQRAGAFVPLSFSLGTAQPVTDRVLTGFRDRIAALSEATRSCLLVAALDHHDELDVLARAVGLLGASLADFAEAERAGLVRVGLGGVAFHHPLVRTAVLLVCDIAARMAAHRALAETVDDDRRAYVDGLSVLVRGGALLGSGVLSDQRAEQLAGPDLLVVLCAGKAAHVGVHPGQERAGVRGERRHRGVVGGRHGAAGGRADQLAVDPLVRAGGGEGASPAAGGPGTRPLQQCGSGRRAGVLGWRGGLGPGPAQGFQIGVIAHDRRSFLMSAARMRHVLPSPIAPGLFALHLWNERARRFIPEFDAGARVPVLAS